jgi:LacI family transcriptional regulator
MAVTQTEIAKVVGVSQTIVSDVLHGRARGRVRPETRQRILSTARQLGYRPNALAQALRMRQSRQIVYLATLDETMEFPALRESDLAGVAKTLRQQGYRLLIEIAKTTEQEANVLSEMIATGICDGGILRVYRGSEQLWKDLLEISEPIVLIGQCPHPDLASIAHDAPGLISQAIKHLNDLGHTLIGLVVPPVHDVYHELAIGAWRNQVGPAEKWFAVGEHRRDIADLIAPWLADPNGPTAIIAMNPACVLGATTSIRESGKILGRDIDLHAVDDLSSRWTYEPGIWFSGLDMDAVGIHAAKAMISMLEGSPNPGPIRLMPEIICL